MTETNSPDGLVPAGYRSPRSAAVTRDPFVRTTTDSYAGPPPDAA